MSGLLDARWRHYYGERYDSRHNIVDSDYHFRLKLVAPVYHVVHFRRWRVTGQAYEKRECAYDVSNRSLASVREGKVKGRGAVEVRGYWGDIVVGPSVAYGVDSASDAHYETRQNQHTKTTVDIAEDNLTALMTAAAEGAEDGGGGSDGGGGGGLRVSFHFLQGGAGGAGREDAVQAIVSSCVRVTLWVCTAAVATGAAVDGSGTRAAYAGHAVLLAAERGGEAGGTGEAEREGEAKWW